MADSISICQVPDSNSSIHSPANDPTKMGMKRDGAPRYVLEDQNALLNRYVPDFPIARSPLPLWSAFHGQEPSIPTPNNYMCREICKSWQRRHRRIIRQHPNLDRTASTPESHALESGIYRNESEARACRDFAFESQVRLSEGGEGFAPKFGGI
jgi:hypothetical protein